MDNPGLRDISMQRLSVFIAVVEQNGYSAAATHLQLAQPSVSYHVRALEKTVGARLLVYRDRSIHVTPEGEHALRAARTIVNQAQRLGDTIGAMKDGQAGHMALGASIAFENQFFFDMVVEPYVRQHPRVQLSLEFSHSIGLADRVLTGAIDLAYVNDWTIPEGLNFQPLHKSELVFLVSPDHELADRESVSPEDVSTVGIISAPFAAAEVISYHQILRNAGVRDPRVTIEIDGIQARMLAAQSGLGVLPTFVPKYAGDDAMSPLKTLRLSGPNPEIQFGLVSAADQPWTPLMSDVGNWLRAVTAG